MTSVDAVKNLKEEIANGNEEMKSFAEDILGKYLKNFMKYPGAATRDEKNRFNSLVSSHIYDKELKKRLIITN